MGNIIIIVIFTLLICFICVLGWVSNKIDKADEAACHGLGMTIYQYSMIRGHHTDVVCKDNNTGQLYGIGRGS
jgi:hypothetical protein